MKLKRVLTLEVMQLMSNDVLTDLNVEFTNSALLENILYVKLNPILNLKLNYCDNQNFLEIEVIRSDKVIDFNKNSFKKINKTDYNTIKDLINSYIELYN